MTRAQWADPEGQLSARKLTGSVIAQALEAGASAAGLVPMELLRGSPSHVVEPVVGWSGKVGSVLVLGLAHPEAEPVLDWWGGPGGTEGNRRLMGIGNKVIARLSEDHRISAANLPYYANQGGVFLKDAAVLAGLGVIGRNNLFISAEWGPRLRLRGVVLRADFTAGPAQAIDPCQECPAPCLEVCPQGALNEAGFSRPGCMIQMDWDRDHAVPVNNPDPGGPEKQARHCRACELACPAGEGG